MVVDKPAGILSTPAPGRAPVLLDLLRERQLVEKPAELRPVHRLDREVSGVLVFARTLEAMQKLTEQFMGRGVAKVYLALVRGTLKGDGEIDLPLHIDRTKRLATVDRESGKPALTRYRVIERLRGLTLVECRPETGRLHQIRVHLAAIGHPLAVDPVYGRGGGRVLLLSQFMRDGPAKGDRSTKIRGIGDEPPSGSRLGRPQPPWKGARRDRGLGGDRPSRRDRGERPQRSERPLIDRLTLHASQISFNHPATGDRVTFDARLPRDFQETLAALRRLGGTTK